MSASFKRKSELRLAIHFHFLFLLFITLQPAASAQRSSTFQRVDTLTKFIASDYFLSLKKNCSDVELIDSIYFHSLELNDGDLSEALLIAVFATIPYKIIPVILPIFKIPIDIPLVSSDSVHYLKKNSNLPKKLLHDSPEGEHGDKDKIAHFFGNAFLEFNSQAMDLTEAIGYFVEVFEEEFIGQTEIDLRDLRTNKLGKMFGKELKNNPSALPSVYFKNEKQILNDEKNINH